VIILFILLVLLGPRFGNVMWWLLQPARYNLAFPNAIFGILGIAFLPWTTLMYVSVYAGGITGLDWLWLGIGLFADLSSYGSSAYGGKKQMSPSKPATPATPSTPAQ
jgi:hypothetical protein